MIYIDASRYGNTEQRTGVENYSWFLIRELVKRNPKNLTLLTPRKIDLDVRQHVMPFPRLWTHCRLGWEIFWHKEIDNLFVPSHVLPLIHPKNSTITIHDVVFKYSPKSYGFWSRLYLNFSTWFAVKRAAKIIVPSEASKYDLIQFYKADPKKIHVIPLGFEPNAKPDEKESAQFLDKHVLAPKTYFLYVGRIEYKKNTDTLLKAFYIFAEKNPHASLVLCGFPGHGGKAILDSISQKWKSRIIQTGYVSESEKQILFHNALAFIFPSRFEGFGLPLLEAMDANVPIVASDIPSSREVAGDQALFFEKESPAALATLMEQFAREPEYRQKIEGHAERLQHYSWKKCAQEVERVLLL